jgi:hypothetical protein
MATPIRLRPSALALMLAGVLALAGCHSGTPAAKRPFAAYRQCLQEHGVQPRGRRGNSSTTVATVATDASTTTTRPDPAAFAAARQACRKLRPAGGLRTGGIGTGPRAAFRKCMGDHGVTLPTEPRGPAPAPSSSTGKGATTTGPVAPSRGGMLAGLNRNDPAVSSALSACRSLLETTTTTTKK